MDTKLQELRRRAGFDTANDFADHIGMNRSTYTKYEQGERGFSLEKAWLFADALGCTIDELAGRVPIGSRYEKNPERDRHIQAIITLAESLKDI